MPYILAILALPPLIYLLWRLAIRGRQGHPGLSGLQGWSFAHRGLHEAGVPENSMAAFRAALDGGYGIELDVHLMSDGGLAVIHDSKLLRTTGAEGNVEDLTAPVLSQYRLENTGETVPTLPQVLELFQGKAPMIVELKVHENNVAPLCQAVCDLMDSYCGAYCLESFDPRVLLWLKKHRPEIVRGQLAENFTPNREMKIPFLLKWIMTHDLGNFLTKPDFIAYRFEHRTATPSNRWLPKGMGRVSWTIRASEDHALAVKEGWIPIFEGFRP